MPRAIVNEQAFRSIATELTAHGYAVVDDVISAELCRELADLTQQHERDGQLAPARTGQARTEDATQRGDSILWLDEDSDEPAIAASFAMFEQLRQRLNRELFLNLHELECHLAVYPPQAIYQKHLDQFAGGEQHRQVSLVLYLNQDWNPADGGELRLYLSDEPSDYLDVSPVGARLVVFLSSQFWHEVRPSTRQRISLTGWFRTR